MARKYATNSPRIVGASAPKKKLIFYAVIENSLLFG